MRARYSAFARGLTAYLLTTWHPTTRPTRLVLDPEQEWLGLQVLSSSGGFLDAEGVVEFRATWRERGVTEVLHERSRFMRDDAGSWRYLSG
jgi:SEC-C motif-containing protein